MKLQDLFEDARYYDCSEADFTELPEKYPYDITNFDCTRCRDLLSLKNAPKRIDGYFDCYNCVELSNLIGAPQEGITHFYCGKCEGLTSLEGAPTNINGEFNCSNCSKLSNLIGCPQEGVTTFDCSECKKLTSLEGLPSKVSHLRFFDAAIESLDYFEHNVCEIDEIVLSKSVKTGVLNLLRIKNLKDINTNGLYGELFKICKILQRYLTEGNITPRTILKARKELIDAGCKDYL